MKAATVEPLMPFPRASSANCFFHASKPAAVLPHGAALAWLAIHVSATTAATVVALNCPSLVIENLRWRLSPRRLLSWRIGYIGRSSGLGTVRICKSLHDLQMLASRLCALPLGVSTA